MTPLDELQRNPTALHHAFRELIGGRWPGRAEALVAVARKLGRRVPEREYLLPEDTLEWLVDRARAIVGSRVAVRGEPGHKGRVGDGVERLLLGGRASVGAGADHPAAEIKSVPVLGEKIVERVKLGVVNAQHNPLDKCGRILFVFVEQRGRDSFVRAFTVEEFDWDRWERMWRDHHLIETAAGSPRRPARGLYLTPHFFYDNRIWPCTTSR
jgi:hypothetical protein